MLITSDLFQIYISFVNDYFERFLLISLVVAMVTPTKMVMFIYLTSEHNLKLVLSALGTETILWLMNALNRPNNSFETDFKNFASIWCYRQFSWFLLCLVKSKFLLLAYEFLTTLFIFIKEIALAKIPLENIFRFLNI